MSSNPKHLLLAIAAAATLAAGPSAALAGADVDGSLLGPAPASASAPVTDTGSTDPASIAREYSAVSNIMKTKHDTVKNSISNVR